jgi:putative aldouronate transport system substrate-binding protein
MAFQFLAALYTDPTVMNFWQYGIEGVNYQVLDDGTAYFVDEESASNYKYHQNTGWAMGNQFLTYVWNDGTKTTDYWEKLQNHNKWMLSSPAYGFMWDASEYSTQLAALSSVLDTYYPALTTGSVGVDKVESTIDAMNDALYAAGLEDVIEEKQKQLDAWIEENGGPAETPEENLELLDSVK